MPNLCWLDIETTGLDPVKDQILEVGIVITTFELDEIASKSWIVATPNLADRIENVHERVFEMHKKNGLWRDVRECTEEGTAHTLEAISFQIFDFLRANSCSGVNLNSGAVWYSPLCGASVHFDRSFIKVHMPYLDRCWSHQHLDVSSFKLAVEYWFGKRVETGKSEHRALADCRDSIEALRRIRARFMNPYNRAQQGPE